MCACSCFSPFTEMLARNDAYIRSNTLPARSQTGLFTGEKAMLQCSEKSILLQLFYTRKWSKLMHETYTNSSSMVVFWTRGQTCRHSSHRKCWTIPWKWCSCIWETGRPRGWRKQYLPSKFQSILHNIQLVALVLPFAHGCWLWLCGLLTLMMWLMSKSTFIDGYAY